ncbi:SusD/RagB family nutrient-binding outer membrane lipoprotein [Sphingobacterium puteale]|nr:SusD/RagB family nutrient-binding outer membrane lipoprotein [Sphingobacterium puteale]
MKQLSLLKYALVFTAITTMVSCSKKFDDSYYIDPNNPSTATGMQLLANAEFFLSGTSANTANQMGVHYPQYLSLTTYTDNSRYISTNLNFESWYKGPLKNIQEVKDKARNGKLSESEGSAVNQIALANILESYFMLHMTDRWGDLPYSDALKGSQNRLPKYDTQKEIYTSLFKQLKEASANLDPNATLKNEIIFNGNMSKWKKVGNSIRLLMALRLSKVDATWGKQEFVSALADGVMASNTDNFAYPHLAEKDHENFWYNSFTRLERQWFALSKPLVDYMKPKNDPRLPIYGDKNQSGEYVGLEYGKAAGNSGDIPGISLLGAKLRQQNSPVNLVTYPQVLFAMAEAAKLGWISGGDAVAETNYKNAIKESINLWTANATSASAIDAYINQPAVAYSAATAIQQIAEQRWIHLFLNGYEAWAEWRRTGFPVLTAPAGANGNLIPRREGYPTQEASNNTVNYNAAVAAFPYGGADGLNARVWWDKP